jgi:hypothetical protein
VVREEATTAWIGDWKAVRVGYGSPLDLYNLRDDPAEQRDVAAKNPELVQRFESFLKSARVDSAIWPVRKTPAKKAVQKGSTP